MHYEVWIKGQLEKVYDHLILAGTYLHMKGFLYSGKGYLFIDNKNCKVYEVDNNGNKKTSQQDTFQTLSKLLSDEGLKKILPAKVAEAVIKELKERQRGRQKQRE